MVTGGQYDVDMTLEDPAGKVLYKDIKKQYDSYSWKAEVRLLHAADLFCIFRHLEHTKPVFQMNFLHSPIKLYTWIGRLGTSIISAVVLLLVPMQ